VNETVTLLDTELPETCDGMWRKGTLYFMPFNARHILKFNPQDESAASVEEDQGDTPEKYEDTVLVTNWWLYGIPFFSNRIVRFNPIDQTTSTVGEAIDDMFGYKGGVLGRDGFIYAAK
jgi:hypothetical protein